MELFIAIDFDAQIVSELNQIAHDLKIHENMGSFEPPENYHLTLLYLNELEGTHAVIEKLDDIRHSSFELHLNKLGSFVNASDNVLWVDVKHELEKLRGLQHKVDQAMDGLYSPFYQEVFCPHITLAYGHTARDALEQILSTCPINAASFTVTSFHLYEVILTAMGRRFRKLSTFPLDRG